MSFRSRNLLSATVILLGSLVLPSWLVAQDVPTEPTPAVAIDAVNDQLGEYNAHEGFHDLTWSPDGSQLAVANDTGVLIFVTAAAAEPAVLNEGVATFALAFHPSGEYLASVDTTVKIWNVNDNTLITTLNLDYELGLLSQWSKVIQQ